MFCGIGRNKDKDCKKPQVSPAVFGKNPSTSPITVKEKKPTEVKPTEVKLSAISPVTVDRQTSDKIYNKAVKLLDVENETEKLTHRLGLVTPGKLPGRARGLTAYKTTKSKTKKKGGKRKTRRTRKTKRKRKTRKKRKRKTKQNQKPKRKKRRKTRKGGDPYYNVETQTWDELMEDINSAREGFIVRYWIDLKDLSLEDDPTTTEECEDYGKIDRKYKVNISVDIAARTRGNMLFSKAEIINEDPSSETPPPQCYWTSRHSTQSLSRKEFEFATKTGQYEALKQHQWISIIK